MNHARRLEGHISDVLCCAFHHTDELIASGSEVLAVQRITSVSLLLLAEHKCLLATCRMAHSSCTI